MTSGHRQDGHHPQDLVASSRAGQPSSREAQNGPRSLRDQHHELTRELILRSVADHLETGEPPEITVPDVAAAAGVSVRTVYRHFASREELIAAAADWISERVLTTPFPQTVDEFAANWAAGAKSFDAHPNLVRAMAISRAGNMVRSARRARRLEGMRQALRDVSGNLPTADQRRAEAIFGYLINMLAWVTMRDENGFSGEQTGEAVGWAIQVLLDDLRRRNEAAGAELVNKPQTAET
jgi:AcrR family transcriptional regulator